MVKQDLPQIKYLLHDRKVDPTHYRTRRSKNTCLHLAVQHNKVESVLCFYQHLPPIHGNIFGLENVDRMSPLFMAVRMNQTLMAKILIQACLKHHNFVIFQRLDLLFLACYHYNVELIRLFLTQTPLKYWKNATTWLYSPLNIVLFPQRFFHSYGINVYCKSLLKHNHNNDGDKSEDDSDNSNEDDDSNGGDDNDGDDDKNDGDDSNGDNEGDETDDEILLRQSDLQPYSPVPFYPPRDCSKVFKELVRLGCDFTNMYNIDFHSIQNCPPHLFKFWFCSRPVRCLTTYQLSIRNPYILDELRSFQKHYYKTFFH